MLADFQRLQESEMFRQWKAQHPADYLSSCFTTIKKNSIPVWQFHFYDKKEDTITTFEVKKTISQEASSKVFKKPGEGVEALEMDKVKISFEEALHKAGSLDKYHQEDFTEKIIILQQIHEPLWNISMISSTFNLVNIKISATSGEILQDSIDSLLSLKR